MTDPYLILGVAPTATDEAVKHAYFELAKKYHPDAFADPVRARQAEEKMKEINEAFEIIRTERTKKKNAARPAPAHDLASDYRNVRLLLNAGKTGEAEKLLGAVPEAKRDAEWSFLSGCVLVQRGWYTDAQSRLDSACYLDPDNEEYRTYRDNLRSGLSKRAGDGGKQNPLSDFSCQNALCDCLGGDISCC